MHRLAMQFQILTMPPTVAFNEDALPPPTRSPANVHSACQYKRCFLALVLKRNIRLSFAVAILGSGAALFQPSRSTDSAFWNLLPSAPLV
jgi:hypothetical protein